MAANSQDLEDKHSDNKQTGLREKKIMNGKKRSQGHKESCRYKHTDSAGMVVQPLPSQTNTLTCTLACNKNHRGIVVTLRWGWAVLLLILTFMSDPVTKEGFFSLKTEDAKEALTLFLPKQQLNNLHNSNGKYPQRVFFIKKDDDGFTCLWRQNKLKTLHHSCITVYLALCLQPPTKNSIFYLNTTIGGSLLSNWRPVETKKGNASVPIVTSQRAAYVFRCQLWTMRI